MNRQKQASFICLVAAMLIFWSCDNYKPDNFGKTPYDPKKPVVVTGFEPSSGGLATKVFITGSNFGTDLSEIKVYFGETPAPVIGSDGNHLYVLTPRQPGDNTHISVVSHGDSTTFTGKTFEYNIMYIIRTISGRRGTTEFKPGRLAEAEYHQPSTITIDQQGNLFMAHWRVPFCLVRINEEEDIVEAVLPGSNDPFYALGAPTVDSEGVVSAISDGGRVYFTLDPMEAWVPRQRSILPAGPGKDPFGYSTAHSFAAHPETGFLYTRYQANGHLIKVDPVTREGELVSETISASDSYLVFDPRDPNILYIAYSAMHFIAKFDLRTKEHTVFAGLSGSAGWADGTLAAARFRNPNQMIVDPDGNLVVADMGNHCIRKITLDDRGGGIVSTIIGKGGVAGYQDGNPEDALFNEPRGVAITPDGATIYITDRGNNVVRKLTIE